MRRMTDANFRNLPELQPSQFIVIGDTPDDIACAHDFGARSVAVATGHLYGVDELLAVSQTPSCPIFLIRNRSCAR